MIRMKWAELARIIKQEGNEEVRKAFSEFLEQRIAEARKWKATTKDETLSFYLESLVAGYQKALRVMK